MQKETAMRKKKTQQQLQDECDYLESLIMNKISKLCFEVENLRKRKKRVFEYSLKLEDPHALIPKDCKKIEEWLDGHPFPNACISQIYKNRSVAESVQLCCNTYQEDYHIVRCKPKEHYQKLYESK